MKPEDLLHSDEFWGAAFEGGAPFLESYATSFRRGVVEELVPLLDLHREALYYLREQAIWPVVTHLLHIAAQHPSATFVESLDYFLTIPEKQSTVARTIHAMKADEVKACRAAAITLRRELVALNDDHLTKGLDWMLSVLERRTPTWR